jgi:hypothetical protein
LLQVLPAEQEDPAHGFPTAVFRFTHTVSVFRLGLVTLFLARLVLPEKVYLVLGTVSGLAIVWVGATLFWRRWKGLARAPAPASRAPLYAG